MGFSKSLFIGLLTYSCLLGGALVAYQYHREKLFKAAELDAALQVVNNHIISNPDSVATADFAKLYNIDNLRVSVIDVDGNVVFDNSTDSLPASDHRDREEIAAALATGSGYAVRRVSDTTGDTYFYSALKRGDYVVRTAVPYSVPLQHMLSADKSFLWVMIGSIAVMCVIGYFVTRRIGKHEEYEKELEKIKIKRQLTNNINHELKTPLSAIKICLETMIEHPDMEADKRQEFIEHSFSHASRLQHLLDDVAVITRLEEGRATIITESLDLGEIVDDVCEMMRSTAEQAGMAISIEKEGNLKIEGNRSLLTSIFCNLIDNASAYSGGTEISIVLNGLNPKKVSVVFRDNGYGVPEECLDRIFERFFRVDKGRSRQHGGTGLGLSIVRNGVIFHGGTIRACNLKSGGLEVAFDLSRFTKS